MARMKMVDGRLAKMTPADEAELEASLPPPAPQEGGTAASDEPVDETVIPEQD